MPKCALMFFCIYRVRVLPFQVLFNSLAIIHSLHWKRVDVMFCLWRPVFCLHLFSALHRATACRKDRGLGLDGEGCCGRVSLFQVHTQRKHHLSYGTIRSPFAVHGCWTCLVPFSLLQPSLPASLPAPLLLCTNTSPCHFFHGQTCQLWLLWRVKISWQGWEVFVVIQEWWKTNRIVCLLQYWTGLLQWLNEYTLPKDTGGD